MELCTIHLCTLQQFKLSTDCSLVAVNTTSCYICDQIWRKNPASMHTISNLRFYQEWIAGSLYYHIPLHAWLVVALLYWCSEGWLSTQQYATYVTRFETTRLPRIQYQTYNFTRNGLLAHYTIIFHCVRGSLVGVQMGG